MLKKDLRKKYLEKRMALSKDEVNFLSEKIDFPFQAQAKIRYRQETQKATIFEINEKEKKLKVIYKNDQW